MISAASLIGLYSILIVGSSLFGGWLPSLLSLTHTRTQLMLSFVGGFMLGIGMLHMLPHSYVETGSLDRTLIWALVGLLGMFFLIRTFHFHQHGPAAPDDPDDASCADHAAHKAVRGGHHHAAHEPPLHALSWTGVAVGLMLHTFVDGVALSAAVIADSAHRPGTWPAGIGVFLAIFLHKPLDALSITSLMQAGGWPRRMQQVVNGGFALTCPLGAWVFLAFADCMGEHPHQLVGTALALSAGVFLCISLSDLLPEVQFHHHDRLKLSATLVLGVLVAYGMRYLEPAHLHRDSGARVSESEAHADEEGPAIVHDAEHHE
jgi:zinc and cadmium transporter